jgi:hypothetical protein
MSPTSREIRERNVTRESQAGKRSWVVLLYFYAAALVGLGFVVAGVTTVLFGAKSALFPSLGLPRYAYEYNVPPDGHMPMEPTEQQLRVAKDRAIAERRADGLDGMLNGLIVAGVGTPVLVWHLKRGRALSAAAEKPEATTTTPPPTPPAPQPPASSADPPTAT